MNDPLVWMHGHFYYRAFDFYVKWHRSMSSIHIFFRNLLIFSSLVCNISNKRRCLPSDIQTLRSRLKKKRGAAESFFFF